MRAGPGRSHPNPTGPVGVPPCKVSEPARPRVPPARVTFAWPGPGRTPPSGSVSAGTSFSASSEAKIAKSKRARGHQDVFVFSMPRSARSWTLVRGGCGPPVARLPSPTPHGVAFGRKPIGRRPETTASPRTTKYPSTGHMGASRSWAGFIGVSRRRCRSAPDRPDGYPDPDDRRQPPWPAPTTGRWCRPPSRPRRIRPMPASARAGSARRKSPALPGIGRATSMRRVGREIPRKSGWVGRGIIRRRGRWAQARSHRGARAAAPIVSCRRAARPRTPPASGTSSCRAGAPCCSRSATPR